MTAPKLGTAPVLRAVPTALRSDATDQDRQRRHRSEQADPETEAVVELHAHGLRTPPGIARHRMRGSDRTRLGAISRNGG